MGHLRLLKADPHVAHAVQQTGFRRVKRGFGLPKAGLSADDLALTASKKSPWVSLREALDQGLNADPLSAQDFDSHVVHDEGFFNRLQYSADHRYVCIVMYVSDVLIACEETNNDNVFGTFKKIYIV